MRTEDPLLDFLRWDQDMNLEHERLPTCDYCGKRIHEEHLYVISDDIICPDCIDRNFRKNTDDYME